MPIHTSGKWWLGLTPKDIKEYLEAYTQDVYQSHDFRLATCACGSVEFRL